VDCQILGDGAGARKPNRKRLMLQAGDVALSRDASQITCHICSIRRLLVTLVVQKKRPDFALPHFALD